MGILSSHWPIKLYRWYHEPLICNCSNPFPLLVTVFVCAFKCISKQLNVTKAYNKNWFFFLTVSLTTVYPRLLALRKILLSLSALSLYISFIFPNNVYTMSSYFFVSGIIYCLLDKLVEDSPLPLTSKFLQIESWFLVTL